LNEPVTTTTIKDVVSQLDSFGTLANSYLHAIQKEDFGLSKYEESLRTLEDQIMTLSSLNASLQDALKSVQGHNHIITVKLLAVEKSHADAAEKLSTLNRRLSDREHELQTKSSKVK
jgi:chromosome segregation ATPase